MTLVLMHACVNNITFFYFHFYIAIEFKVLSDFAFKLRPFR